MRNLRKISLLLVAVIIVSSFSMGVFAETYTVKDSDVLLKIAQSFGTDYMSLVKFNNIADPNMIYIGDKIKIPEEKEDEDMENPWIRSRYLEQIAEKYPLKHKVKEYE